MTPHDRSDLLRVIQELRRLKDEVQQRLIESYAVLEAIYNAEGPEPQPPQETG